MRYAGGRNRKAGHKGLERPILTVEEIWRSYDAVESRLTTPVSERMLDLAGLAPGMRVLDLATGRGEPALGAARRVGPEGLVLGVELAEPLARMTMEKAKGEGLANLEVRVANAETLDDLAEGSFQAVTARWGLMYFTDPLAALAQARKALAPGGAIVAALWAEPERVPYFTLPRRLLERYRSVPAPAGPEAPGTFRYAETERIERDFRRAGFAIDHIEEMEIAVYEADCADAMVGWVRALGLTRLLNDLPEEDQLRWERDLTAELERGQRTGGVMQLGGVTRIVRAR